MKKGYSLVPHIFITALAIVLWGCASVPPRPQFISGPEEIKAGERASIVWSFSDCDSVTVEGLQGAFRCNDTITVAPSVTTTYKVKAIKGSATTTQPITVRVRPEEIKTGQDEDFFPAQILRLPITSDPSPYFIGAAKAESPLPPFRLKTMRVLPERDEIHALVLDEYGNFMSGIQPDMVKWMQAALCDKKILGDFHAAEANETVHTPDAMTCEVVVCADLSAAASARAQEVIQATKYYFQTLPVRTKASFIPFDHRISTVYQQQTATQLAKIIPDTLPKQFQGLTAVYLTAYQALSLFRNTPNGTMKILVLLVSSRDNASISYLQNDVLELAKQLGVIVYPVLIGPNTDETALSYIAKTTGGRTYTLGFSNGNELRSIMGELANSIKAYYTLVIPAEVQTAVAACTAEQAGIVYELTDGTSATDTAIRRTSVFTEYPARQILALFTSDTDTIAPIYEHQFTRLASLLSDNPDKIIELTGHSSLQGNFDTNKKTGLQRALLAKKRLVKLGVPDQQIRVRSSGSSRPINYFEAQEWQANMNRRVELRWLDPSFLPFEITVATVFTEEEAIKITDKWQERGYNAEYEMIVYDRVTGFIVKLWGFPTFQAASDAKSEIEKRFRERVHID